MAAKKKNTEGFAFLVDALQKNKGAVYAEVKAAADNKGLVVHPIMFGRAKLKLGLVKAGAGKGKAPVGKAKEGVAKASGAGRPLDGSSKSGQVRALLSSGLSVAEIAKKVGCKVGLVYNLKSKAAQRGPGRPPKIALAGPRRGPGRPRKNAVAGLDGLGDIVAMVRASQQDLGRYRSALEKIGALLADVLG